jgi:anthranilate phosphoribosyltransferase
LILHSIDGFDEVSLTGPVKFFNNDGEKMVEPHDFGLPQLKYEDIKGGESVEGSAKIFMNVLEGKGSEAQNNAIAANAGMALYAANRKQGLKAAVNKAREALVSGKALASFKNLMNGQGN